MIFRGFQVFEYALWLKMKTRKCQKSTESFLNQKIHISKIANLVSRKLLKSNQRGM